MAEREDTEETLVASSVRNKMALAGRIIAAIGTPSFASVLDKSLAEVAQFDLVAVLSYSLSGPPRLLHDRLTGTSQPHAMHAYLKGGYLLDAVYVACMSGVAPGLHRLSSLAPDDFFDGDYYNSSQVHPCISMDSGSLAEEVVFINHLADGRSIAYSLMRSNGNKRFSTAEYSQLAEFDAVVLAAIEKNWSQHQTLTDEGQSLYGPAQAMEVAFQTFGGDTLTDREKVIVQLILRGHSSLSIAKVLEIAEGTVKNHRKHIHAKFNISSQAELFALFLKHVLDT